MTFNTKQEALWAGEFGDQYSVRNQGEQLLASNLAFFSRALASAHKPESCIEFGANIGMNLRALKLLFPEQDQHAIEINSHAAAELGKFLPAGHVHQSSLLDFVPTRDWDLVLIKGVLIHVRQDCLPKVYDVLHQATACYLLVCEYYNPTPVSIPYRGHADCLFKRDFCGELLDRYQDLRLVDYGFAYHRAPDFPQDDITWFLMERRT
ncbi:MAG: pseudaminic acid biosynthesis-associated methylase [Rhodanobacter sp.]|nr:MAG: pseudaminic acid biosynthesis-associated methylase [Rhodanobacter sp.]